MVLFRRYAAQSAREAGETTLAHGGRACCANVMKPSGMLLFPSSRCIAVQHMLAPLRGAFSRMTLTPGVAQNAPPGAYFRAAAPGWPRRRRGRTLAPGTRFLRTRGKRLNIKTA